MLDHVINSTKVVDCWHNFSELFWNSYFWLPEGVTWEDFKTRSDVVHAKPIEIWTYPFLLAGVFAILRIFFLRPYISSPLALWLGVNKKAEVIFKPNDSLEKLFAKYGVNVPSNLIEATAEGENLSFREIQFWLRRKKLSKKQTKMDKFNESFYKLVYHIGITIMLFISLNGKPWLINIKHCIIDYPHHNVDSGIWWLYMSVLGYYWSGAIYLYLYPRGKNHRTHMIHHISTIILLSFSWTTGFFRFGSLVLLVHEPTDIPLMLGKLLLYADLDKYTDITFSIFVLLWFIQRCYLFPFWLLKALVEDDSFYHMSPVVYLQYGFLVLLMVLNVVWALMILKIAYKKLVLGDKLEDSRSSDEASADENGMRSKEE